MQEVFMTAFVDELNKLAMQVPEQQISQPTLPTMTANKLYKQNTEFGRGQFQKQMKKQSIVPNVAKIARPPK